MKLLLLDRPDPARLAFLHARLRHPWQIEVLGADAAPAALRRALGEAEAVVTQRWTRDTPPAPALRLLQLPGAGYDAIDFSALPPACAVCNVFEHEIGISEYIVLGLLEWEIRLSRMHERLRRGEWRDGFVLSAPFHGELFGKRVGFIGYGRIARATARRLAPFGVETWARTRTPARVEDPVADAGGMEDLGTMLEACDYVVVACPLTDRTRGLIDADALRRLGPDSVIVNVARGPVIDEDALFVACRDRVIAGAIIDTWYRYPDPAGGTEQLCRPSRHPFEQLDNVIMTPHASGWSTGLMDRRYGVIAENLNRLADGEPLHHQIRAPGGPPPE